MDNRFNLDGHKMYYHLDRVVQWERGDKQKVFPIYVEVSPVGHCNHRCTFCAVDYIGYVNRRLDTNKLKDAVLSMAVHGVRSIMYAGEGEPLLHPDIAEIVRYTDKQGIDVALTTNAVALTKQFCQDALRHCTWIKVSCNAGNPQDYATIHQTRETDWNRTWENIRYAVELRKNQPGNKTTIGVQCLLLPDNAKGLHTLAKQCRKVGVDYLVIKPYSQHLASDTKQYADIRYDNYEKYTSALSMYASSNFEIIIRKQSMESWDEEDRKKDYCKCYSTPYFWAYVMASGDVYGCSAYLEDKRFCYGNIHDELFSKIWLGDKRRRAMDFVEHELDISECRKNCRMHKINTFLWSIKHSGEHKNFI